MMELTFHLFIGPFTKGSLFHWKRYTLCIYKSTVG